jgi:hypothetical protein
MNWKFWTWPAQIRELQSKFETEQNIWAQTARETVQQCRKECESETAALRSKLKEAESENNILNLQLVSWKTGYEDKVKSILALKAQIERLSFPFEQLVKPDWFEKDEAELDRFMRSDTGVKLLLILQAMEQDINRKATEKAPFEFHAGQAKGFRHALIELIKLCGAPQPLNEANASDTEKSPSDVAEQFRA